MTAGPLRILQVSEAFTGGLFASVTGLANGLAAHGHAVHIAFSRRAETPADVRAHVDPSITLHELGLVRSISPAADLRGYLELRRLFATLAPDVIHLHSSKAGVLGRLAAGAAGTSARTFYSPRGLAFLQEDHSPRMRAVFRTIERTMARWPCTVVACSASEFDLVRDVVRAPRAALVENAVDVDVIPARRPRDDGRVRIGTVGRITYARNPPLFAALARRLARPGVEFRWIGGGEDADTAMLAAAGVHVTGWLPRASALDEVAALDIHLHPSLWEGMPIALIEAQVCGVPAVARDVVGNRDVVRHGETGFIGRELEDLAAHLERLIGDATLRETMGARARELARPRFRLERLVGEMEALYRAR